MSLQVTNTSTPTEKPSLVMLIYGEGGVGKTTFVSTAPKPLLLDCEGGSKYLGLRGLSLDVAQITKWADMKDVIPFALEKGYETLAIDPVGELMDKLKRFMIAENNSKLVQKDGTPSMAGWGWLKTTMRTYIKGVRDTGLNIIFIAHVDDKKDEDRIIKEPMIETKLRRELINMVDVVGYMTIVQRDNEAKRVIIVDPEGDKYTAKDRTGQLGRIIEPDFSKIINAAAGTEKYSWSHPDAKVVTPKAPVVADEAETEQTPSEKAEAELKKASKK